MRKLNRSQRRVREAIDNTKRYKALAEKERARQKALQAEITAKKELDILKAKTQLLKGKRGSVSRKDLIKGTEMAGRILKKLDKKIFG